MGKYSDILSLAIETARKAGTFVREARQEGLIVDAKSRIDFVSDKDRMSEDIIRQSIKEKYPDHLFFGEESVYGETLEEELAQIDSFRDEDYIWVVDPIDGTVNYIRGYPQYVICIGVIHRKELVVGVIYDPSHDHMYSAEIGCGAFLNGQPIHVSDTQEAADGIITTSMPTFSMDVRRVLLSQINAISENFQSVRVWNCAGLSLAAVAAGVTDADYEIGIHLWDMAAGIVIIREAGGKVCMPDGSPYKLTATGVVATNALLQNETIRILNS